jgi:hypothetical protein
MEIESGLLSAIRKELGSGCDEEILKVLKSQGASVWVVDVDSVSVTNIVEAFMKTWTQKKAKRRKKQSIGETSGNITIKETEAAHARMAPGFWVVSDAPLPTDPTSFRPSPTLDGMDLIGQVLNDPDLGLCRVIEFGPPHRLAPGEGNATSTQPVHNSARDKP